MADLFTGMYQDPYVEGPMGISDIPVRGVPRGTPMQQLAYGATNPASRSKMWDMFSLQAGQDFNPVRDYQNRVVAMANADQERRINELAIQREEQALNPYFAFEEGKRRGYIPEAMSLAEYNMLGKRGAGMKAWQPMTFTDDKGNRIAAVPQLDPSTGTTTLTPLPMPEGYSLDSPLIEVDTGDRIELRDRNTGAVVGTVPRGLRPEDTPETVAEVEDARKWATYNQTFETTWAESAGALNETMRLLREAIGMIEANPDMDTGFIEGIWSPMIDTAVARLDTLSTVLTVPALAEAKLNPVTEQEFESIKSTFAKARRSPQANLAVLRDQLARTEAKVDRMEERRDYYNRNNTMKGYLSSFEFGREAAGENTIDIPGVD